MLGANEQNGMSDFVNDGSMQQQQQMGDAMQGAGAYGDFDDGMQGYGGGYGGGPGGFRGRGGFGGFGNRGQDSTDLTPAPAPPMNAPTGPKAMREGLPNTGWASRAFAAAQKPTPTPAPESRDRMQSTEPLRDEEMDDAGDRSHSRRRDNGDRGDRSVRDDDYESDETYARRKERERRKRKEREGRYEDERDTDRASKKYRSRSESRTDDSSRRRHRDRDEEHRSSRSHRDRDRSKDRHRRRHRSRSPGKDDAHDDYSRRKSKREHDDYDDYKDSRSRRKHSRREDDEYAEDSRKDVSYRSSKYDRDGKSRSHRDSERDRPHSAVIQPPDDELGFKIKGSRSAKSSKENGSMGPPSSRHDRRLESVAVSAATSSDPYAEERARAQQDREAREAQRRLSSTQSSSLGKRVREDEETIDAPRGPKGDRNRAQLKKGRKERRISYKYEDEVEMR